jgi:hypothetical protein
LKQELSVNTVCRGKEDAFSLKYHQREKTDRKSMRCCEKFYDLGTIRYHGIICIFFALSLASNPQEESIQEEFEEGIVIIEDVINIKKETRSRIKTLILSAVLRRLIT